MLTCKHPSYSKRIRNRIFPLFILYHIEYNPYTVIVIEILPPVFKTTFFLSILDVTHTQTHSVDIRINIVWWLSVSSLMWSSDHYLRPEDYIQTWTKLLLLGVDISFHTSYILYSPHYPRYWTLLPYKYRIP